MPTTTVLSAYNIFNLGTIDSDYSLPTSCITTSEPFRVAVQGFPLPGTRRSMNRCDPMTYGDCLPGGQEYDSTVMAAISAPTRGFQMQYHSPASECPPGWETVGVAEKSARGSGGDDSVSGAFSATHFATGTSTSSRPWHNPKPNILLEAMGPGQTAVLCCPSNFTADPMGDCYQTLELEDWPQTRCDINGGGLMSRGAFTYNGERVNGRGFSVTVTESAIEHQTSEFVIRWERVLPEIVASTTGYTYFPMMTLVHGEPTETRPVGGSSSGDDEGNGDADGDGSGDSSGSGTNDDGDDDDDTTETEEEDAAETSDNAAYRGVIHDSVGGLGTLAVIWGVAVAAGAALMVPY